MVFCLFFGVFSSNLSTTSEFASMHHSLLCTLWLQESRELVLPLMPPYHKNNLPLEQLSYHTPILPTGLINLRQKLRLIMSSALTSD